MDKDATLLLCRIYVATRNNNSDKNNIVPCLLHANFYETDEKLSEQKWDYDLFIDKLLTLDSYGYVNAYVDGSSGIKNAGIEYVERLIKKCDIKLS